MGSSAARAAWPVPQAIGSARRPRRNAARAARRVRCMYHGRSARWASASCPAASAAAFQNFRLARLIGLTSLKEFSRAVCGWPGPGTRTDPAPASLRSGLDPAGDYPASWLLGVVIGLHAGHHVDARGPPDVALKRAADVLRGVHDQPVVAGLPSPPGQQLPALPA